MNPDVKATVKSHKKRMDRLGALGWPKTYGYYESSPFFTTEATRLTMEGTQFDGEHHRHITPYLQELAGRGRLVNTIDVDNTAYRIMEGDKFDVAIIGSGPHGVSVASWLAEKRPELSVIIIEKSEKLGGQWRSYGPKPVFQMNSRVRRADRRLPALPRTKGNINTLGTYAPLELSDIPTGSYAWNTEMGEVCAINAWMSADTVVKGVTVQRVNTNYDSSYSLGGYNAKYLDLKLPDGREVRINAKFAVDATGIDAGKSRIVASDAVDAPGYFTAKTFYQHFATHDYPLEMFNDRRVMVIGKGDSALTVLEALIGNLPSVTYGRGGVGRMRPEEISWMGAPDGDAGEIEQCLRNRYKNGIVQSLRRDGNSGVIVPNDQLVNSVRKSALFFDVEDNNTRLSFPEIVVDCTVSGSGARSDRANWEPSFCVGPNAANIGVASRRIERAKVALGIPENRVALWATMQQTDLLGELISNELP